MTSVVLRLTVRAFSRCILPVSAMSEDDSPPPERKSRGRGWMPSLFRFFSQPSERGKRDREYYEKLPIDAKRALYTCGEDYVTIKDIPTWEEFAVDYPCPMNVSPLLPAAAQLSQKVSLWRGDITRLEIDAIVNAANSSLLGGGGVDGAIHRAAGGSLRDECAALSGCSTGDAKITSGHKLPAKYILHTVGPMNCSEQRLRSCYSRCLELVQEHSIRSVAFCCIATGVYGYPNEEAAHIALETIRRWLETDENANQVDRVIFCVFLKVDYNIYRDLLHRYFPVVTDGGGEGGDRTPPPEEAADGDIGEREEEGESRTNNMPILDRSVTELTKPTASSSIPSEQQHSSLTSQQDEQEGGSPPSSQRDQQEGGSPPSSQRDQQEGGSPPSSPTHQQEEHKEEVMQGTGEETHLVQEAKGVVEQVEQELLKEKDKQE